MAHKHSESFKYKGTRIHYYVAGEGKPLILLHGALLPRPWANFDDLLEVNYKTYELILPGFDGNAPMRKDRHTIELYSEVLEEFLKQKQLLNADIIGFSLGGVISAKTYLRLNLTSKLLLIGFPQRLETSFVSSLFYLLPLWTRRKLASSTYLQGKVLFKAMNSNLNGIPPKDYDKSVQDFIKHLAFTHPASIVDINYEKEINQAAARLIPQLLKLPDRVKFVYGEYDNQSKKGMITDFLSIEKNSHSVFGKSGAPQLYNIVEEFFNK